MLNLGFTGDIDHHAREARAIWGGGLCVTRMARTRPELTRVADNLFTPAVQAAATQAGVYLLGGGPDETANVVKVEVLIADAAAQRWVDGRYGLGDVVLDGSLKPLR